MIAEERLTSHPILACSCPGIIYLPRPRSRSLSPGGAVQTGKPSSVTLDKSLTLSSLIFLLGIIIQTSWGWGAIGIELVQKRRGPPQSMCPSTGRVFRFQGRVRVGFAGEAELVMVGPGDAGMLGLRGKARASTELGPSWEWVSWPWGGTAQSGAKGEDSAATS